MFSHDDVATEGKVFEGDSRPLCEGSPYSVLFLFSSYPLDLRTSLNLS